MTAGIRWMSIVPGSGYGNAAEDYLSGLRAAGIPVSWTPLGWPSATWNQSYGPLADPDLNGFTHRDIANLDAGHDTVVVHSIPIWHDRLVAESASRRLVAFTTWETDRLPDESVAILNRHDRVLVPSRFNAAVFESSGVTAPISVVPHIAKHVENDTARHRPRRDDEKFVFYLIATWTTRKAILDSVEAFLMAFTDNDNVVLSIHTTPEDFVARAQLRSHGEQPKAPHQDASWFTLAQALAGRTKVPEIVLSARHLNPDEMNAFHAQGDCFISLSRGEGWGLGAFEAAAFGNPVIVTGWGATIEFLPRDYRYCVDYDLVPTMSDRADEWFEPRPGEHWAKARISHAATILRYIFEHRSEAYSQGQALQSHVMAKFNRAQVTRCLLEALAP